MAEADNLTTMSPENSSSTAASGGRKIADFECNICLDLAQDPVITLCGHLHCWPCLYKWLKLHPQSHECPVCRSIIEEEKLIPLYGRGKATSDPRLLAGVEIPRRPAGQRPDTAPPPQPAEADTVFGRIGEVNPMARPRHFGIFGGLGGVLSPILSVRIHEFADANGYGGSSGFDYGNHGSFGEGRQDRESRLVRQGSEENLKKILILILLFVLIDFIII